MFKKYIPVFICFFIFVILVVTSIGSAKLKHLNTYPNLPAPIGEQKILITSAGQAAEGALLQNIADNLHLNADYRPRALGTDLYDYNCVVIALGFSANGLSYINRTFQEEMTRIEQLVEESKTSDIPLILVNLSGSYREGARTFELFEQIVPHTDYYIGIKNTKNINQYANRLKAHDIPVTLVNHLEDINIPFNSIFR